jgi:hypothetical protein
MHFQNQACPLRDGPLVVSQAGPVGGADLTEADAALLHDLGDAELTADLHQLAPGNDGFAAFRQGVQNQENGGGIVVHHQSLFRSGQDEKKVPDVIVPESPLPFFPDRIRGSNSRRPPRPPADRLPAEGSPVPGSCEELTPVH